MMVSWLLATLAFVSLTESVDSADVQNYKGCLSTSSLLISKYKNVVNPLTWDICIRLCTIKMTMYAGVQVRQHACYCGNDLVVFTDKATAAQCEKCHDNTDKECGGDESLSLYQLREHIPLVLLVATPNGIMTLEDKALTSIPELTHDVTAVDYHYTRNEIYYISKNKILRSSYIPHMKKYNSATVVYENEKPLTDLAVDWVADKIYWSCLDNQSYYESNLDGTKSNRIIYNIVDNRDMAYNPYTEIIYTKYGNELISYNMVLFKRDMLGKYHLKKLREVAVDIHQERIYVIGSYDNDNDWYIASIDYNCTEFRVIYSGPELSNPYSLEVFNDLVVWANSKDNVYTVYSCKISLRGRLEKPNVIYEGSQKINKVKIFDPEAQTPSVNYQCKKMACTHGCTAVSLSVVRCTCPEDMIVAADGKSCAEKPLTQTTTPSTTEILELSTTSIDLLLDEVSTTEETYSTHLLSSLEDPSSNYSLYPDTTPKRIEGPPPTISDTSIKSPSQEFFSTFAIPSFCDFYIIAAFLLLLYLALRRPKRIRTLNAHYNKNDDLAELSFND